MAVVLQEGTFRQDMLQKLRLMASQGVGLAEMVTYVQKELGFSRSFIVPVLGYFCQAFSLPLRVVLPLREWWETRNDDETAGLLAAIRGATDPRHETEETATT